MTGTVSSAKGSKETRKFRRKTVVLAIWLVLLALTLVVSTYAWFTGNRFTNVVPESHTVSGEGADLLISTDLDGPFGSSAVIATERDKILYPISTMDLANFWQGAFQDADGITRDYNNISGTASNYYLTGTLYLRGSGTSAINVYLFPSGMSVTSDPQLLSCLRLGLVISGQDIETVRYIFALDDLGNTSGVSERVTTAQTGVVVDGSSAWSYGSDPAVNINDYSMDDSGNNTPLARAGADKLFTLPANATVSVEYYLYMEGCDVNCIEAAQSKDVHLQFAFAGETV